MFMACALSACQKTYLNEKPSQNQKVPVTLADYQAIFDNTVGLSNPMNAKSAHTLGIIGGDEFFISEQNFNALTTDGAGAYARYAYTWERDVYVPVDGINYEPYDFTTAYNRILRCNIVLEGLENIPMTANNESEWKNVKGSAHFYRALDYYNLCQLYSQSIGMASDQSLGMPLRTESDPTVRLNRATLQETYNLITADLKLAEAFLPQEGVNVFRPSQLAVQALWARIYLQKEDYEGALLAANKILETKNQLMDYNELRLTSNFAFPMYGVGNKEVFFSTAAHNPFILSRNVLQVDSILYAYYEENDLRRDLFFKKSIDDRVNFWGSYYGNDMFFTGFAVDEVYLIRAEVLSRLGQVALACEALNILLRNRYESNSYQDFRTEDKEKILAKVLRERRKQLVFRGIRWEDLRRLNLYPETSRSLTRLLGDQEYELLPNSKRYVWPFPPEAIAVGGFIQNDR